MNIGAGEKDFCPGRRRDGTPSVGLEVYTRRETRDPDRPFDIELRRDF